MRKTDRFRKLEVYLPEGSTADDQIRRAVLNADSRARVVMSQKPEETQLEESGDLEFGLLVEG